MSAPQEHPPGHRSASAGASVAAREDDQSARAARILVAEDDPAAASVLETLLRLSGYEIMVVGDGPQALATLESGPSPDLLLLDWMLPGLSGLEICRSVRLRWDPVALPVLIVTARTDPESITAAFAAGANDYLTKPFLGSELRARIASHLRIRELVAERRRVDEHLMEREKLSSLGVLVSSVAHDLTNPLAAILAHAQLLLEDPVEGDAQRTAREILGGVERCNRIVRDLLAFARRKAADREAVDAAEVLHATLALREHHLRSVGIRVEVEIDPAAPPISATPHQLQQVFLNILINAEQALRSEGECLRVSLRERVGVGAGTQKGVEIVFHNDGPPIPPETLSHIFEPFFTTKAADEGTGLGLAICDRIIREHGGEIQVESTRAGTSFRIHLPAMTAGPGLP